MIRIELVSILAPNVFSTMQREEVYDQCETGRQVVVICVEYGGDFE